ncbi:MAG: hypothetical protein J7K40_02080 [candidate division Zixibacteria bacterium]|nr:hypothetical protein [candidate division Zixibacteria bacterium]
MKKILMILITLLSVTSAWGGLIYDNNSGGIDDTFVVQFFLYDTDGQSILDDFDTVYVVQAYNGSSFNTDTIEVNTAYRVGANWPETAFFEKKYRAAMADDSLGGYTWYALSITGSNYHTVAFGNYYVNDVGIGDLLALPDTGSCKADVSGLSTFDESSDKVALVDSSAGDISYTANNAADYKATGFSTFDPSTTPVVACDTVSTGDTLAVKKDSLIYQGAGGGSDTTSIKAMMISNQFARVDEDTTIDISADGTISAAASLPDSLFDTLTVIHEDIEALSLSGGGTEAETLIVLDASDSTLIQSAKITIRTLDQSTAKAAGLLTDVNGKRIFALDADSFWVEITHNNYQQVMDTIAIASGGGTDSLYMTKFDPGNPSDPDLCRVYGWVYDISGEDIYGVDVAAEIPRAYHPVKYSDLIITPFCKSTSTDSSGYWYIDLIPCSKLSGDSTKYQFIIKYNSGVIFRTETDVPDSASWQLK